MVLGVFSALSLVVLVRHSTDITLAAATLWALAPYEWVLEQALGWLEPWVRAALAWVAAWFWWDVELKEYWRHIFVVMSVYFFRDAAETWRVGRPCRSIFLWITGAVINLATSIVAGCVLFDQSDWRASFLIAAIPWVGVMTYDLLKLTYYTAFEREWIARRFDQPLLQPWPFFRSRFFVWVVLAPSLALPGAWLLSHAPLVLTQPNPGAASLLVLIVAFALYWLVRAFFAERGGKPRPRSGTSGATLVAKAMLVTIAGALALLLVSQMLLWLGFAPIAAPSI